MAAVRDRRQPLLGGSAATATLEDHSHVDLEALEAENDRGIAALGDRVGALRGITTGIHGEVESQHRLLDNMAFSMGGVQLSLRATADKMTKVMSEPQKRRMVYMAGAAAMLLFFLYLWLQR
ncbi:bet1-like SNARE 1-1 isoform X2 isoform A [Micractinium conductrix]|uniref:Bet1-like SNARE 1-1 isoform X2 isoform A n=1 Tax=Micractinium conductrix TaxID=554055 RepID=A0A2P6VKY5_9CHLO|nr:bet1-like SNARE 1-1 isoform X2 isoform A [Micractinium conductrix]|eukprot:PSC74744.1 bet1-like SNARE 1-1 isoform X2 isoform A [Micractinium conductrix]